MAQLPRLARTETALALLDADGTLMSWGDPKGGGESMASGQFVLIVLDLNFKSQPNMIIKPKISRGCAIASAAGLGCAADLRSFRSAVRRWTSSDMGQPRVRR